MYVLLKLIKLRPDVSTGPRQNAEPGALDDVVEDVLEVVEAEVWGEIGEEKEAGAFVGGCKEAKRARGIDSYQLLASGITFRTHIGPLLQPVRALLPSYSTKLSLRHFGLGCGGVRVYILGFRV